MAARSEQPHAKKDAERPADAHGKGISGEEGKIAGIRKPKHRLRGIKLAAAAAALAVGLAAAPASARAVSSIAGPPEISFRQGATTVSEPESYSINLPDEFAAFPKADSVSSRAKALEEKSKKFLVGNKDDGTSIFQVMENNAYLRIFVGKSSATFRPMGSEGFMLEFSSYEMQNPVARMEKGNNGKVILHILDAGTNTDLTLSFPPGVSSAEEVKAKAYHQGTQAGSGDLVSRNISNIVNAGEEILQSEKPKTIEEAREVYSRMGAEMVNQLREDYSAAPPGQATELAKRGQAVITAVLLRIYVSKDENALMKLDTLRTDPTIDKNKLESFARENGIIDEFRKIWPQCSASSEDQ